MKNRRFFFLCVMLTLVMCVSSLQSAFAADENRFYEIALGAGSVLQHSFDTRQALIAPAINCRLHQVPSLWFRLEGNMEFIYCDGKLTVIGGTAPMMRFFLHSRRERDGLYIEGGAGLNIVSRHTIGNRDLGGSFMFSPMAGVGYGLSRGTHPMFFPLRYRHISNGGIYTANDGLDAWYIMGSLAF